MHLEMARLVQSYMLEKYGYEAPVSEYLDYPYHDLVYTWWIALGYFRMKNHYEQLEDVPEGVDIAWITDGEAHRIYRRSQGKWMEDKTQSMSRLECKAIYGK